MSAPYSISLKTVVEELDLTPAYLTDDYRSIQVITGDVSRPGLPLSGFYDYFDNTRVQVMGKLEATFLRDMPPEKRYASLDRYMATGIRFLILAHGAEVTPEILETAQKHNVCLFTTEITTCDFMAMLIISLNQWLAPRTTLHGVLMEIHGEGVLIMGESGVGKSENAMSLLSRGHRLVADDAVEVRRINRDTLIGSAPEMIRYFMEVRGIGLIDARHMFGIGAVKPDQAIDLVVRFELWEPGKHYDRLGIDTQSMDILGVKVPLNVIPVRPGRNLGAILELAAMNNRERKMGYNAAQVLVERHDRMVDEEFGGHG